MKSYLFEHYKKKYGSGGKLPVRKTGMWYQDGDVVVPSNEITMKGPNGEKDYFDSPILGIGLLSGDTQVMQPGEEYTFPKDNAVLEKKMQKGAVTKSRELKDLIPQIIPGVNDVLDFNDIIQGAYSGNRTQMNQGIIGMASPGLAGKAVPTLLDYVTEKTLGKDVADHNQSKREGIVNMSTSDLQKLYTKYGPGGYDKWKKSGFPKLQKGATVESKEMTPEQQARFNAYMRTERPRNIQTPEWLSLSSGATDYARTLKRMPMEQFINMPGDISKNVTDAFNRGIDYSIDGNIPGDLGQFSTEGTYNPFGQNTLQDMYSGLTYNKSFPKGSIRLTPDSQEIQLRGNAGRVKYKRQISDEEKISQLAFDINFLPEALTLYGEGRASELGLTADRQNFQFNPQYNVRAGIRGEVGPLSYDINGNYNPDTGYRYDGEAELSLLKNRLRLSGNVSGSQEEGLESISAEARAKILKNLNLKAAYRQSSNQPGSYNIGLNYSKTFEEGGEVEDEEEEDDDDKEMVEGIADILKRVKDKKNRKQIAKKMVSDFEEEDVDYNLENFMQAAKLMQMGGMSIPGVNGTVVGSTPMSLQSQYKKNKKK